MKILTREEFMLMPNGTVYSEFKPMYFNELNIKVEQWEGDFLYDPLIGNIDSSSSDNFVIVLDDAIKGKKSIAIDFNNTQRDGMFDDEQMYAVYEKKDLEGLINRLTQAYNTYEP